MVLPIVFVFRFLRSQSAKNETQKEDNVPLRTITSGLLRPFCKIHIQVRVRLMNFFAFKLQSSIA